MQICLSSMFTYVFVHIIRHTIFKIVHALEQSFASVSQQRNSQKTLILYFAPKQSYHFICTKWRDVRICIGYFCYLIIFYLQIFKMISALFHLIFKPAIEFYVWEREMHNTAYSNFLGILLWFGNRSE